MHDAARPIKTTVLDITSVVKTAPHALFTRVWVATHHMVQMGKTRPPASPVPCHGTACANPMRDADR